MDCALIVFRKKAFYKIPYKEPKRIILTDILQIWLGKVK